MENAQTPDEGKKTVETPVTKPVSSTRKPAAAPGSQAKSSTAKPSASATRKPAAKKAAARKTPARSTSAAATSATPAPEESTVPKPSAVAAKSAAAKPGSAKTNAAKRPATKTAPAGSAGTKTPTTKSAKSPRTAASKTPSSRAAGAKRDAPVTAAEDAERTLTSRDNTTSELGAVIAEPRDNVGSAAPKPRAPKLQAPQSSGPKPTKPRSASPTPVAPAADPDAGAADVAVDDSASANTEVVNPEVVNPEVVVAEAVVTEAVEAPREDLNEAEPTAAELDAVVDETGSLDGVDEAAEAESVAGESEETTAEMAADTDDKPISEEKPDAVLAGLARLRALASQFAAPAAEAAAKKAAAQKLADEKAAADKAETDKFEAERAEAERAEAEAEALVEAERAEAERAEAERAESERLAAENADVDEAQNADVDEAAAAESTTAAPVRVEPETAAPEHEKLSSDAPTIVVEPELDDSTTPETEDASAALVAVDVTVSHGLEATSDDVVLQVNGLTKDFGDTVAVDDIRLSVRAGVFYGIVGPNGAGKTTTLSMITGLLRPDSGNATVNGVDVWESPEVAKRSIGVLPDRLRIFDRLTGSQLLYYSGVLRGLEASEVRKRSADLATAFGLDDVMGRLVSDYSSGMLKKVALAAAMIHSPRLLVLDEPFESVDPVSAATVTRILKQYVTAGGTVLLSSHRMELVQRVCSHVAVIVEGKLLADGTIDEVRNGMSLEDRFVQLTGKNSSGGGLEWLSSFSD